MPYTIERIETKKRVCLTYERELSPAEITTSLREVEVLMTTRQWSRLSVDVTTLESLPTARDLFTLSESMPRAMPRRTRIAMMVRPDQVRVARLIEHLMRHRGAFLTFFTEAEKADRWMQGRVN